MTPSPAEIERMLADPDPGAAARLYAEADRVRRESVGDDVFLRGLVELSNHCRRRCAYCGIHAGRRVERYRLSREDALAAASRAAAFGYGSVVLQAGEDPGLERGWIADLVKAIKGETGQAVTLSLGERERGDYEAWRLAGADRYLLRFETSDPGLFRRIHPSLPGEAPGNRMELLGVLRGLGYEVGSGAMVGIPGQTWASLAGDVALFRELDLDMIGIGPYLPHPDSDLALYPGRFPPAPAGLQVPNDEETACRTVALARLVQPFANIPATTALALIDRENGRRHGLARGANVVMPNLTPERHRRLYEIYPAKSLSIETAEAVNARLSGQLAELGRTIGSGRGDSRNFTNKK